MLALIILFPFLLPHSYAQNTFSQNNVIKNPFIYNCTVLPAPSPKADPYYSGFIKPSVTDLNTPPDAYFPVLIVFVQFANDPGLECSWWPKGSAPVFLNQMIASDKKYPVNGNWWDTYSEESELLSDYWMEQSRGRYHVIGKAVSVVLDYNYYHYEGNEGYKKINDDIYAKLKTMGIDWRQYDKWGTTFNVNQLSIQYTSDGYVDMIYKIMRSRPPRCDLPAGGSAALGESETQGMNYLIDPLNNIYINGDYYFLGSGVTLTPGFGGDENDTASYIIYAPLTKSASASFSEHEHGHYIFAAGHVNYGKMSGSGNQYGLDECLSPWESIYLGYMAPKIVNYDITDNQIGDYSSRNSSTTGEVLQVPVLSGNEFFLIANRTKKSLYDKIMWGDTAHDDPYRNINPNYGKGVYIYHVSGGYIYPAFIDQECADGLYSWSFRGYEHPDWSEDQNVEYYARDSVSYNNDMSLGSILCADGKSIFTWFSIGEKNSCIYCDGTDKIFTNKSEVWTSREFKGDRWDAWRTGYNEVFSPYSSPSTKDWLNNNTGIFIWLYQTDTSASTADFKIYRAGYGGMTEDDILAVTPPSKPMGVLSELTGCENNFQYPMIKWLHNMEPDMINQTVSAYDKKFYNIYKAESKDLGIAPSNYKYYATVNIDKDSIPYFIDYNEPIKCGGNTPVEAIRYTVTAVDNRGWESVKSDFASVIVNEDNVIFDNSSHLRPLTYELKQNYPNPFNPETKINFTLVYSSHVKITVYNLLGEQVSLLLDEFRQPGKYSVKFNGTGLSSGIYFYRLDTPGFTQTKKMILIK